MKSSVTITILSLIVMVACNQSPETENLKSGNPFFTSLNELVQYAELSHEHITAYADIIMEEIESTLEQIRSEKTPDFENVFVAYDNVINDLAKASNNCFLHYWVSPDSLSRVKGLESYQKLEELATGLTSDAGLYKQMVAVKNSDAYKGFTGHRKSFVDDVILYFEHAGVNLDPEPLKRFKELKAEINELTSQYSINMNTANEVLALDEEGAEGLSDNFKESYRTEDGKYEIPVIPATRQPVLNNAVKEETRKDYYIKYYNRGWEKNLEILDELINKRYELAQLMGHDSYASYTTSMKMSKSPQAVWKFLNDLIDRAKDKADTDLETLKDHRNEMSGKESNDPVKPWNRSYIRNHILISKFQVDHEAIREYLPMDQCLDGMMDIFEKTLGVEYRKVENPPVWHEDVLLYEVLEEGKPVGRFYLDLYPRPAKESWFYGVGIKPGKLTDEGYEIPACMLLANFPAPTETLPSMISHGELSTLFHEFGHIMETMSYKGEFATQASSKEDFQESMAQIFENWIWDYDMLSTFAKHYETGEVLPREVFDNMKKAKNVTSGLDALGSLRACVYDMMLYDSYDPAQPVNTDELWRKIDKQMGLQLYVEGTHPQTNWIHINTHPTYYYGYLWAEVYAQDMFTLFKENGLTDTETGKRYRRLILANGTQRDITEAVEELMGRPMNNEAYISSLGLE